MKLTGHSHSACSTLWHLVWPEVHSPSQVCSQCL